MTTKTTRIKDISIELSAKAFNDEGHGEVEGYASVFGNIDHARDVIERGAFTKTLQMNRGKIRFLWQHDRYQPIGAITEIREDEKGLWFKAKFAPTPKGQEARELLKMEGAMGGFSIGFQVIQEVMDELTGIVRIKEIRLLEVSAATFPCNEEAVALGVKSEDELTEGENALLEQFKAFLVAQRSKDAPEAISEASEGVTGVNEPEVEAVEAEGVTPSEEVKADDSDALTQIKQSLEIGLLLDTLRAAQSR